MASLTGAPSFSLYFDWPNSAPTFPCAFSPATTLPLPELLPATTPNSALYRVARSPPFRKPLRQPACLVSPGCQNTNRFVREHAVRSPAVSDDLLVLWNLLQVRLQPLQGHRACPWDVSGP